MELAETSSLCAMAGAIAGTVSTAIATSAWIASVTDSTAQGRVSAAGSLDGEVKTRGGAAGGDRTHDPWLRRPILYPLSYSRIVDARTHYRSSVSWPPGRGPAVRACRGRWI